MNVTIITEYFPSSPQADIRGGVEARCFSLGRELARRHTVTVITSWSDGMKREETIAGMRVLRVGPHHPYTHKGSGAFASRLGFAKAARDAASRIPADIIEGTNFISYLPAFEASRKQGVPAIATYHEVWLGRWIRNKGLVTGSLGSAWERWTLAKPWDRFIAVSEFTKRALIGIGVREKDITVLPNGVDLSAYKKEEKKGRQRTICCVSRLTPQKRVEDLLHALPRIRKEFPTIRCVIIGSGDEEAKLKKLAEALDVADGVTFLGFVKGHNDVIKAIKQSHVFCLPSVVEGFGIVVLEAMASGVPYVCTDIDPLKEITDNGKGGLLCRQKDPYDIASKILALLTDRKLYAQKVEEGLQQVRQYDWKDIARRVEKTYQEVIARP